MAEKRATRKKYTNVFVGGPLFYISAYFIFLSPNFPRSDHRVGAPSVLHVFTHVRCRIPGFHVGRIHFGETQTTADSVFGAGSSRAIVPNREGSTARRKFCDVRAVEILDPSCIARVS